jgi:molybdopterin biosynthesis enzyme
MVAHSETLQRIARLMPLADIAPLIATLAMPVASRPMPTEQALGTTLATDAVAASVRPSLALALRDGWAVRAEDLTDATAYGPVPLPQAPQWIGTGEGLPAGSDAVAPLDAIIWRGGSADAMGPMAPGEGVLAAGVDATPGAVLRAAGSRLRHTDIAALTAADIRCVDVRTPRIAIVRAGAASPILNAIVDLLTGCIEADGAIPAMQSGSGADQIDRTLRDRTNDAVIIVGGTGTGRNDGSVCALARAGEVAVHGIAIAPGETVALGRVARRPVLAIPGRLDSALAVWLLIGRALLARLRGGMVDDTPSDVRLARKVTSRLGLTELVLVRRAGETVAPLTSDYLSLAALAGADGWLVVPAESEGWPAEMHVTIRPLP